MDKKIIISASRRTDIPSFYSDWLIEQLNRGSAEVTNPYNHTVYSVPLSPVSVHSIVLWSKDFAPLLKKIHALKRYELFFMLTLNDSFFLEPRVPSLDSRFAQFDFILRQFGKERLFVRFDPIVHWRDRAGIRNNMDEFEMIIKKVSSAEIYQVKTSFMNTQYRKLSKRGIAFVDLPIQQKIDMAYSLGKVADNHGVRLQFCCNDYLFENADIPNIERSCCIDGRYISRIVGEPTIIKKDSSQRKECQCTFSRDIGDYTQKCKHGCLYCYANPDVSVNEVVSPKS
ncbi:MAG: DUF1848 family protein [bacterium]